MDLDINVTSFVPSRGKARQPCQLHNSWVESVPPGTGYCRECVRIEYENAPVCKWCGTKKGFAFGTGDCGCAVDPD